MKKFKNGKRILAATLAMSMLLTACGKSEKKSALNPDKPVKITVWNYYSGAQLDSFNKSVEEFNNTKGKELGIVVEASSQGSLGDLTTAVYDAADKKVGSADVPNMFPAYSDTVEDMDEMGIVQDINSYLTAEEKAEYIDAYIQEGDLYGKGELKIFPIAKSTEIFVINKTDWDKFAAATTTDAAKLETMEGVAEIAQQYYEWTDSLTATPNDGKAFFGRDAMANYMIIGSQELGVEMIQRNEDGSANVTLDKTVLRKLWDNFYVPYINGYYSSMGRFRSDDMKTGNVISYVGSSSSATFTPNTVTLEDGTTYQIETMVTVAPEFEGGKRTAVQQGAGMVVTKASDAEVEASVEFLKWFTEKEQNIEFSVKAGYSPVKKDALNDSNLVNEADSEIVKETLKATVEIVNSNQLYTAKPVKNGTEIRSILEASLLDQSVADRAEVVKLMDAGKTHEEAVAVYNTDDNFEKWYQSLENEIKNAE